MFKQVGANLNVSIDGTPITLKGTKETLAPVIANLKKYKEKATPALLKEIKAALMPVSTEAKATKEKKVEAVKAKIKKTKNDAKTEKKAPAKATKATPTPKEKEVPADTEGKEAVSSAKGAKVAGVVGTVKKSTDNKSALNEMKKAITDGKFSDKELEEMQMLINKSKKVVTPPAKVAEPERRRGGEH